MTPTAPLPMLRRPDKQVGLRVHSTEWREIAASEMGLCPHHPRGSTQQLPAMGD